MTGRPDGSVSLHSLVNCMLYFSCLGWLAGWQTNAYSKTAAQLLKAAWCLLQVATPCAVLRRLTGVAYCSCLVNQSLTVMGSDHNISLTATVYSCSLGSCLSIHNTSVGVAVASVACIGFLAVASAACSFLTSVYHLYYLYHMTLYHMYHLRH